MTSATFIGVDLAWRAHRNPSGAAVLQGDATGAEILNVARPLGSVADVLAFIDEHTVGTTVVAIDAPLIIRNPTASVRAKQR